MSGQRDRRIIVWLGTALFVLGCVFFATPAQPARPTADLGAIIVQTANAAQTQTATFLPTATNTLLPTQVLIPTFTLAPTSTPLILVSLTPTFTPGFLVVSADGTLVSVTPAPTLKPASTSSTGGKPTATEEVDGGAVIKTPLEWDCQILEKSPVKGSIIKPGAKFYISWTAKNTGTKDWPYYGIDFVYMTGYGTEARKIQDLPVSVSSGGKITLSVAYTAPKNDGVYNVFWSLRVGSTYFCPMKVTFEVK